MQTLEQFLKRYKIKKITVKHHSDHIELLIEPELECDYITATFLLSDNKVISK